MMPLLHRKPTAAWVTYSPQNGGASQIRWRQDRTGLIHFAPGVPVKIEDSGNVRCGACGKTWKQGEKRPARCDAVVQKKIRLLHADGTVMDRLFEGGAWRTLSAAEVCNADSWETDLELAPYRELAEKGNSEEWSYKEA